MRLPWHSAATTKQEQPRWLRSRLDSRAASWQGTGPCGSCTSPWACVQAPAQGCAVTWGALAGSHHEARHPACVCTILPGTPYYAHRKICLMWSSASDPHDALAW